MSQKQTAVVDAKGIYLGMFDEGAEIPDGALRISSVVKCDLPVGEYFWVDDEGHPFGGFFWPVSKKLKLFPGVK
jgi:hypothetical protein